ncbi:4-hydroxythreonine-4-phosphate dehydrogenase PdxA [candidate division WOR-1 bacterium RIFOXYC2_FULL_37_10]|uniref:4-hydroxythreonine-4-phosphate dehydrogenase PdxA n=1 Tax=candidate division WOR-1 bacterium RIFOXYB2_FULL_37_13 TaxID=1802579 RepID=A0A1F4SVD9_UNCSA|nr:MAG: 4-hydroxythreonine-4-phosphate dehydrogenase PdxA [candidate division WOR-1 bacterium RIFOXYA2_FULL_37_7]OGC24405.1 MAG: 4-hydroxythreonine-4-phosphate dehydrogenase PdxA [candidate division WOR-1 bacterium RIFOXYB2_FULL_37_13]OGC37498.1 MAG: 4-hydroxythreonine-4-phosphate dehydrogenase PdxA [candidate division WOR-1 bacterium RIFOXYC2_FULL_37_10]
MKNRSLIAVTMGDPAGIGPEVCVKALSTPEVYNFTRSFIIGDLKVLQHAIKISKLPGVVISPIEKISDARFLRNRIDVLTVGKIDISNLKMGKLSAECGKASILYIEEAIRLAKAKKVDAIVTAPINKEAIHKAGYKFDGHTEILAKHTNTKKYAMLFVADKFWVVLATTHLPLKLVSKNITQEKILTAIELASEALKMAGKNKAKIAVAGLNPHAGEGGIFGDEEIKHIAPAVKEAQRRGLKVYGPISPDAVFNLANAGLFDLVVAMYHDQGLIPLKLTSFNRSVNVTLGLPFVRTSVDHGTGFDIAGKGVANPQSLIHAIKVAAHFARAKQLI